MSKYMVNGVNGCWAEKHMCGVGVLSAEPGRAAEEDRPPLETELKMYSWTRGGNTEDISSHGMITGLMSLEGPGN